MLGDALRDRMYSSPDPGGGEDKECKPNRKWQSSSGLFVLMKQNLTLSVGEPNKVAAEVLSLFNILVYSYVRT